VEGSRAGQRHKGLAPSDRNTRPACHLQAGFETDAVANRHKGGVIMSYRNNVSRRYVLAMSAAAGSLAIGGGFGGASAQTGKRIEQFAPETASSRLRSPFCSRGFMSHATAMSPVAWPPSACMRGAARQASTSAISCRYGAISTKTSAGSGPAFFGRFSAISSRPPMSCASSAGRIPHEPSSQGSIGELTQGSYHDCHRFLQSGARRPHLDLQARRRSLI
jgi:hypothetical protein